MAGARTVVARLATAVGSPLAAPSGGLLVTFPTAETLGDTDAALLPMPAARQHTVHALARAIADGRVVVTGAADRDELRERLRQIPGIGEWTVACILMRLGDTDAFAATDLGVRRALQALDRPRDAASAVMLAEPWRPWRATRSSTSGT